MPKPLTGPVHDSPTAGIARKHPRTPRIDMTQLATLTLTKTQLDRIPADERLFYFMAGQLLNDVNILTKLLIAAKNEVQLVKNEAPNAARRSRKCFCC